MPRRGEFTARAERNRVRRVHEQRQVGERVLDLGALVEARAADHLVADPVAHQHVLEHPALSIRPVEDRDLVARLALVHEPLDLGHDEARLGVLVLELAHVHRIALAELRPEELVLALAVVGDHPVRRVEDRLRRAIVLLELDDGGIGEVALEAKDVLDVGAAEAVDRVVGEQPVRDEVVRALDVDVVDRRGELESARRCSTTSYAPSCGEHRPCRGCTWMLGEPWNGTRALRPPPGRPISGIKPARLPSIAGQSEIPSDQGLYRLRITPITAAGAASVCTTSGLRQRAVRLRRDVESSQAQTWTAASRSVADRARARKASVDQR